jgi:hypothetical protein
MPRKLKSKISKTRREVLRDRAKMKSQKDFVPVARLLGKWLKERFLEHFEKQGVGPRGGEGIWKARKKGQYYQGKQLPPRPVLIRSGAMRNSMTYTVEGGVLKFSFRKSYWVFHQYGSGRMYRPIFVVTPHYRRVISDSVAHYRATGVAKIVDKDAGYA